jgi:hypothetical protein
MVKHWRAIAEAILLALLVASAALLRGEPLISDDGGKSAAPQPARVSRPQQ